MQITEALAQIQNAVYGREVRQAIHDGIKRAYDDAAQNGNSNMEVNLARGSFDTLNDRLDDMVDADESLADGLTNKINRGNNEITLSDLSQEVRESITGGSTAVVGKDAVAAANIQSGAVTPSKIKLPNGYLPETFDFKLASTTRAHAEGVRLYEGDEIHVHGPYSISVMDSDGIAVFSGWAKKAIFNDGDSYTVRVKHDNDEDLTDQLDDLSDSVQLTSKRTSVRFSDLDSYVNSRVFSEDLPLVNASIDGRDGSKNAETNNEVSLIHYTLKQGESIELVDDTFEVALWHEDSQGYVDGWNTKRISFNTDKLISLRLRRKSAERIAPTEGNKVLEYRSLNTVATLLDLKNSNFGSPNSNGAAVRYVSPNGSDSNDGSSASYPLQTFQQAIDSGATKIFAERGKYFEQSLVAYDLDSLEILPYGNHEEDKHQKIHLVGGKEVTDLEQFNEIERVSVPDLPRSFEDVFVNDILPISTSGTRPQFNALLWEINHDNTDQVLKPVLSLEEVESETGTFFYDGSFVYINRRKEDSDLVIPSSSVGFDISNVKKVTMSEVKAEYYLSNPMKLNNIAQADLYSCEANYSGYADGFNLNYTFGELKECVALKNRNDGYNNHFVGEITLTNCKGINNYDDGASPHESCSMTIIGGEYSGNGKGGFSPVSGASGYISNARIEDNRFGLYVVNAQKVNSFSNLIKGNGTDYWAQNSDLTSVNDVLIDNVETSEASFNKY